MDMIRSSIILGNVDMISAPLGKMNMANILLLKTDMIRSSLSLINVDLIKSSVHVIIRGFGPHHIHLYIL